MTFLALQLYLSSNGHTDCHLPPPPPPPPLPLPPPPPLYRSVDKKLF